MLSEPRAAIDQIDQQLVELLEERMKIVEEVARIKSIHDIEVLDSARELLLLKKVRSYCENPETADLVEELYIKILMHSKNEQVKKMTT